VPEFFARKIPVFFIETDIFSEIWYNVCLIINDSAVNGSVYIFFVNERYIYYRRI